MTFGIADEVLGLVFVLAMFGGLGYELGRGAGKWTWAVALRALERWRLRRFLRARAAAFPWDGDTHDGPTGPPVH